MEEESISDRLARVKANLETRAEKPQSTWSRVKRKVLWGAGIAAVLGGIAGFVLTKDYVTKRQDYPVRNVLFSAINEINVAGNKAPGAQARADFESNIKVYEGEGIEAKLGTILFESKRETKGDIRSYQMNDSDNRRISVSTNKSERFQSGWSIRGSLNFREEFAHQILSSGSKETPRNYTVYKLSPERGLYERDIDVVDNPNGQRTIFNRLVETRSLLGWYFGKETFRTGTALEDYAKTPQNNEIAKTILEKIHLLDSDESKDAKKREKLADEILRLEESMQKKTIYSTSEDGFFKILPQGSTIYLGENPSNLKALKHWFGLGRNEGIRMRVNNQWDLFPGRYPYLTEFHIGSGKNAWYPFDKYNNGGYTIKDKFGDVARIKFTDFGFKYGQDILYSYFLDLNGDGKIDEKKELIGETLIRTTHDERIELEQIYQQRPENDTTLTVNYFFMAPSSDLKKGKELFRLCACIESMMPDQLHRGFGKHSLLGYKNDITSDILAYNQRGIGNLSRSLTEESTLVAKYDIIRALIATGRPYAEELSVLYGVNDEFAGQFQASPNLRERWDFGALPWLAVFTGLGIAGYLGIRKGMNRLKNKHDKSVQDRLGDIKLHI